MREKIYQQHYGDPNSSHVLIFLHDFWDYHKSYLPLAKSVEKLSKKKISTLLIDAPGFGLSGGTRGHLDHLDSYCQEIAKSIDELGEKKIILGGHGFGALLALKIYFRFHHLFSQEVTGLMLSNPFFAFQEYFTKGFKDTAYILNGSLGKLKVPYTNAEKLFTSEMREDPLHCKNISFRLFGLVSHDGPVALEWGKLIDLPLLLMTGCASPFYRLEDTKYFSDQVDSRFKTLLEYPDLGHWLFQNEETGDIMKSLGTWILSNNKL